ncbi:MAG: hypothetical protein GY810_10980 [Aureispira sp.]|nr:hypothetical protein [Aureispira sp.]
MSKKIYLIAILLGLVLSAFLFFAIGEEKELERKEKEEKELQAKEDSIYMSDMIPVGYYLVDSMVVNNNFIVIIAEHLDGDPYIIRVYQTNEDEKQKPLFQKKIYGYEYSGTDTIDFNNDGYMDVGIHIYKDEKNVRIRIPTVLMSSKWFKSSVFRRKRLKSLQMVILAR